MEKIWNVAQPDEEQVEELMDALDIHRAVAEVMVNRGITEIEEAKRFLSPSLAHLDPDFDFADMDKAVERIMDAVAKKEKVVVLGDYDVDGVTATALMLGFLEDLGLRPDFYVPHRLQEGYGFRESHVGRFTQYSLIITVDCGISSLEAVDAAGEAGIDVIVIDHHNPGDTLPNAHAVLNPKREDCPSNMPYLAAVGVAFFLCIKLRAAARDKGIWPEGGGPNLKQKCDLVALGTIADLAPLVKENRILVQAGMQVLRQCRRPGIVALARTARTNLPELNERDVAFGLAPRLNAPGRIGCAQLSVEILLTNSQARGWDLAQRLEGCNRKRQKMEYEILDNVLSMSLSRLEQDPKLPVLVLGQAGWHSGVLGIVAARLMRRFNRPVFLVGFENGVGKGSGRSIPGVDLHAGLTQCAHLLEAYGGHAMAAGLTVREENFTELVKTLEEAVRDQAEQKDMTPRIQIDSRVALEDIGPRLADEIESLGPFGVKNPEPIFYTEDIFLKYFRMVGEKHWKMAWVRKNGFSQNPTEAIWFHAPGPEPEERTVPKACFKVQWNRYRNLRTVQLVVESMELEASPEPEPQAEEEDYF